MAAERARQAQQLEAFVNQNAARPCTPSTVLREARVRHGYDVSYLLRATAPPSGPALPPSRRSPSRHQFGRLNIAAAAASGCSGSGPAASGTGHAAFGREEEVDGEDLDEADLRMLDAGFAGEGDGWRGDPRQRRGPRLPATITIKAPAPHRFGSVLLAPPGAPGATAVAASAAVDSGRGSSISNGSIGTCAAGSLVQLVSARSTRLGPHIDSPPPAARPTPFASGTKRISFACVPDATAAGLSGPGGPSGTGSSGSCGGSKVTRAPASVAVLMDRVSEDQVAAVVNAGVAAALSPRARTADPHSHHLLGGGYGPRGGGGSGGGSGVVGGGGVLQPSCSPRLSARGRDGACRQAAVMPGAAGTALGSRGGGGTWTRRFSLECQQPTLAMSSLAGGSPPGENASSTGGAGHASVRGPCVPGSSCSGATQQGQHAAAVVAPPQQLTDGALLPRACSPCCLHSTPRSVVGGRAATASTAAGKRGAVAGGSPPRQAAIRRGPSGPAAAASPCYAQCGGGPRPATTTCCSSLASDTAAAAATPFSATASSCSSPQSHRASPLPSACSSPVPPSAAFAIARRRSIDPQLSVVGGRANSRAGSGSLAVGAISSCCPATGSTAACGGLLDAAAGSSSGGEPAGPASVPALACARGSGQADGLEMAGCATGSGSCTGTDKAAAGIAAVPVAAATPAPPGVAGLGSQSAPLPNVASSPPVGDACLQHHHQQFQHQHQHPWPPSRAAQLPLSAEDVAGSHHGSTTTAVSTAGIHPYPHWHGGSHVMFPELAAADTATATAMAGRATTSALQLESLPLPRLASCGSGGGGETGGGVHAGAVTCRISELSSSGRSMGEYQRATSRARRYSAPYPESVSGTSAGASTRICHGSVNGYSSNLPSQLQLSSRATGTADVHRFPAGWNGSAAVEPALASERASPAAGGGGIPQEPHLHYSYQPQQQQQQQQQQRRRPSDHDGSDGGALPPPQQRHSQSGAAQQLHVHVIGPVASPAAAAATEAAAVSRMTRVMRAESRKGPADQDWTLDPEAVAAHAARVLGAASADQVPVAAAGTAAFGRGHCVRLHGHAHEPTAAPAPRVSGSGDASGGGATGAAACAFPEEARRRSSHTGEGGTDAAAAAPSAGAAPPAAGLGSRRELGLNGSVGPAVLASAPAARVAGHGHGYATLPHLPQPQPQRLPFLPGVSRLQSKLTPGGPQQQPAAGGLPAAAVSGGGTGGAHVPPTSAGSWSASAAAAATTCAAATRGPISPAGVMRQQQQMASSRPVTSGARLNATPSNAQGVSPPPSPPLTAKSSGRSHKRAGTATAAAAATAAGHAMPPGAATAAGHAASCRGSAAPFGTGREGPTADCASSGRGADAAAPVAAAATAQSVEMEERASILLRIKNALSFLHRDE